ncbi:hypothetical protein [Streptomyces sp. NPDC060366]|uniref:hypothetical protein n=1 Tax=Streptomyces sp. NPDC060366 TaxID=3347105 RepID=UPI003669960A
MSPINAFGETAALFAVLNGDQEIVGEMLPGERATFAGQLDALLRLMTDRFGNDRHA